MMTSLGHEVFLYGGVQNEANVTEFISVVSDGDHEKWFGGTDWDTRVFDHWDFRAEWWAKTNLRISAAIAERKRPGDILCLTVGVCQEAIAQSHPELRAVESGIGYEGIIPNGLHVFESYAWMHYVYGMMRIADGRFFDAVIPNSFDDEDYMFNARKDDYLLFLGRHTPRKGTEIVRLLAERGHKIISAGQADVKIPGVEHVGVVRGFEKTMLLANAKALLAPTLYIEPFGGVVVEAMLSGTPVITSDFGAFTETVRDGIDGFRCHTLADFEEAVARVDGLHCREIRKHAEKFLTTHVRYQYHEYFNRVATLDRAGWYESRGG